MKSFGPHLTTFDLEEDDRLDHISEYDIPLLRTTQGDRGWLTILQAEVERKECAFEEESEDWYVVRYGRDPVVRPCADWRL
jgi:hypothetical protein